MKTNVTMMKSSPLREFLDARMARYISVARALGISPTHMTRLLNGESPVTPSMAARLAELFGEPVTTFLPEAGDE